MSLLSVNDQALSKKFSLGGESQKINSGSNGRNSKGVYSGAGYRGRRCYNLTQTAEDLKLSGTVDPNVK